MTALAGLAWSGQAGLAHPLVDAMLRAQARYAKLPPVLRGDRNIVLGRALYPLLSEDKFDQGPQVSADGNAMCVADVRLDNRSQLAADIGIARTALATMCDAAVVLAAWLAWDTSAFDRLRGDFAIAIYDLGRRRLVLARDFLGQRPLFYHRSADATAFASMPSGLLSLPSLSGKLDISELANYLANRREAPKRSYFDGVVPVPAGHWLEIAGASVHRHRYWQPPAASSAGGDLASRTANARRLFDTAIAVRLRDAGSLASHLSGGMDSGAVTLGAAAQSGPDTKIIGYTAVPPPELTIASPAGRFIDERDMAGISARQANNIDHRCVAPAPADFSNRWDEATSLFQRPLHGPCNYRWVSAIYDYARASGVKTLLIGQVGNLSVSYQLPAHSPLASAGVAMWRRRLRPIARWLRSQAHLLRHTGQRQDFLNRRKDETDVATPTTLPTSYEERIASLGRLDFGQNSKGVLAGWGIDLRDPTADRDLVDFCLSLPDEDFVDHGRSRALARRAFNGLLPPEVLDDDRRGLQSADWRLAMLSDRSALLGEIELARAHAVACRLIDLDALQAALCAMGDDPALGQADERLLRLGALRALAACHFIRSATSHSGLAAVLA